MPLRSSSSCAHACSSTRLVSCWPTASLLYSLRLSQPTTRTTVWSAKWLTSSEGGVMEDVMGVLLFLFSPSATVPWGPQLGGQGRWRKETQVGNGNIRQGRRLSSLGRQELRGCSGHVRLWR